MKVDVISRLLRFYRKHLARFILFRLMKAFVMSGYRCSYFLYSLIAQHPYSGNYVFIALSEYTGKSSRRISIDLCKSIEIPTPSFSGYCAEIASKKNPAIQVNSPALDIVEFTDAMVAGGIDFIFAQDAVIHHDLFRPPLHFCPAEGLGVVSIYRPEGRLKLRLTKENVEIPEAASMIGQCSGNYAHWLTETLPKLSILDTNQEFYHLPLLVDDGLHPNIYASLDLINKNRRKIVKVGRWEPVTVNRLITVSQPGYERYIPHRISNKADPYINRFSQVALRLLRDSANNALEHKTKFSTNVYLARNVKSGNLRQIENLKEVESAIRAQGIQRITPETMTFAEQVSACIDAEIIVAPIGASLANMIFAPPGCKIVALSPYYDDASYFYYSNLAGVLGHKLHYVLGPQGNESQHPIHRNYQIDVASLTATLEQIILTRS